MAETPQEVVTEGGVKTPDVPIEPVHDEPGIAQEGDPYVSRATSKGWKPKEEWQGPEEDWIDAKTFVKNQSWVDKVSSQNKKIAALTNTVTAMQEHHKKVFEASYKKALRDLQGQKMEAVKEGDVQTVQAIDDQINEVHGRFNTDVQTFEQNRPAISPDFTEWIKDNDWYHKDTELHGYADGVGFKYAADNPGISDMEVYDYVRQKAEERFPEKFGRTSSPSTPITRNLSRQVESANAGRKPLPKKIELNEMERTIMKKLVKTNTLTEAEYMADIAAIRGV